MEDVPAHGGTHSRTWMVSQSANSGSLAALVWLELPPGPLFCNQTLCREPAPRDLN